MLGIPVREIGTNTNRKRGLPFGKKVNKRQIQEFKKEMRIIERMIKLREEGLSFREIASILNNEKIPTKTKISEWSGKVVWSILAANKRS